MGDTLTAAVVAPSLTLPAPAKLNLFLHVTGRRADGYHLLESVFVPINLADTIRLTRRDDGVVRLVDPPPGLDEHNELCCRAARALQATTGCALGVDIQVSKRIPQGAGLGGGSSDAATALIALNRLWQTGFSRAQLQQLGLQLGADVPVFIFGQNAFAEGIGEELHAVALPPAWYVVLIPPVARMLLMLLFGVLTNFVSNNAAGVLGTPIAVALAQQLGLDPRPFVLAVLFGCNLCFATPMGYQTNLLVMSAAGYRFADFLRAGGPLFVLVWLALSLLIARNYGL